MAVIPMYCLRSIFCLFSVVPACIAFMQSMVKDEKKFSSFDVKPGAGSQFFSVKLDNVECTFTYKAQGGTKEEWALTLYRDKTRTEWLCASERPSGHSYLFFEEFQLEVKGAQLSQVYLERQPGSEIPSSEYIIDTDSNNDPSRQSGAFYYRMGVLLGSGSSNHAGLVDQNGTTSTSKLMKQVDGKFNSQLTKVELYAIRPLTSNGEL